MDAEARDFGIGDDRPAFPGWRDGIDGLLGESELHARERLQKSSTCLATGRDLR